MDHLDTMCTRKKELSFPVDVSNPEGRSKLDKIGQEIAVKKGMKYEGYSVYTGPPHSLADAVATLFFID
ncbi:MAG: hypothetical protein HQ564_01330 [Candidatus Saganbacteria bacterium]|nr:hypothetical protein [Candidatus Saganbacteria bacterium]